MYNNGNIDLMIIAQRASALFVAQAQEAGRECLIPSAPVYSPGDVDNILKATEEVAGNGRGKASILARLQEMRADVEAKQVICRGLLGEGDVSDAAFADKDDAQAMFDGACEIACLVLGEEV